MRHRVRDPPWELLLGNPTGGEDQGQGPMSKRVDSQDSSNPLCKDLLS